MIHRGFLAMSCVVLLGGCGPSGETAGGTPNRAVAASPTAASASRSGPPGTGCVDHAGALKIWTDVNSRLNAIVLDPKHAGVAEVATGSALADIQDYIQTRLVANGVVEREVDRLDNLTVTSPACDAGLLRVSISMTATTDDYVHSDGRIDHDPAVGKQLHLVETFVRVGVGWKESSLLDLSASPPPSGPVL